MFAIRRWTPLKLESLDFVLLIRNNKLQFVAKIRIDLSLTRDGQIGPVYEELWRLALFWLTPYSK